MALGAKRIETRSWGTCYRGWLAIQASKGGLTQEQLHETCGEPHFYEALCGFRPFADEIERSARRKGWIKEVFPHGNIVAIVNLVACPRTEWLTVAPAGPKIVGADLMTPREMAFGDFADGRYGWVTTRCFRLPEPIPFKAKQGLCDVDAATLERIREQWRANAAR
jgi:hypothetical protein